MASPVATCSPTSLQLRLAFSCRSSWQVPAALVRMQVRELDRRGRLVCAAENGERRRFGSSLVRCDAVANDFSGWSDSGGDEAEKTPEYDRKKWIGGMVGAGVAGIVLVGGLIFAVLSLSKRSNSRSKLQMEPFTTEQQVTLDADEQGVSVKDGDDSITEEKNDSSPENETGKDEDSQSPEFVEAPTENKLGDEIDTESTSVNDVGNMSNGIVATQENFQYESAFDDDSVAPDTDTGSFKSHEPEIVDRSVVVNEYNESIDSLDVGTPEPASEVNRSEVELTNLSVSESISMELHTNQEEIPGLSEDGNSDLSFDSSSSVTHSRSELVSDIVAKVDVVTIASSSTTNNFDLSKTLQVSAEDNSSSLNLNDTESSGIASVAASAFPVEIEQKSNGHIEMNINTLFASPNPGVSFSSAGIPAPSVVSAALQVLPGKVLVPSVVDQVQGQALAALQVLKVIEADVQPTDLCTRREYARWLVTASNALSSNSISKVYPAMYIENVSELAFDDITPEDPDFAYIQGLAEAGLISSKLSRRDMLSSSDEDSANPLCFCPESSLSRQDLVSWKMALEKRQLPEADRKVLRQVSGFIDTDKIHPDACPAIVADVSAGELGIVALAFGNTRLFQPDKPVTKSQVAIALAIGEASDLVSEELARIEAESMAENAVLAHNELVAQVKKDIDASFEKELILEKEKIEAVGKMAEQARHELEILRAAREEDNLAIMKERAAIEAETEVLSKLRREVEEQLQSLMSNKVEIAYEKERINKLKTEAENENQELTRLQYELEVERKALSMARTWAEDEAKRAREQAKALEEARDRWGRHGIKVVVDSDLHEEAASETTWVSAGEKVSVQATVGRAETLVNKLKAFAAEVKGKSKDVINMIIAKIVFLISKLKEWAFDAGKRANELQGAVVTKVSRTAQELQQNTAEFGSAVKEGAKRVAGDCRVGVEKLTQKFKT